METGLIKETGQGDWSRRLVKERVLLHGAGGRLASGSGREADRWERTT